MSTDFQVVYSGLMDEFPAKGSLIVGLASGNFRLLAVGTDGTVPIADSTQATGIRWGTVGGGGGAGAPTNAQYVVMALDATLTDERVLAVNSTHLSLTDGGAGGNATLSIANDGVTFAKMANLDNTALTGILMGRTTAGVGDPEVIVPGIGMTMALGQLIVATNGVSNSKIRQSVARSVVGRSAATTGNVADIVATTDGGVLRRNGTTIGFGQTITSSYGDGTVTLPKLADLAASTLIGRQSTGAGVPQAITLGPGLAMSTTGELSASGSGTVVSIDVQEFTTAGVHTWTKPAGAMMSFMLAVGGGAGGGSGRRGAVSTARFGGGGGAGGGISRRFAVASALGATENIVVGAGGAGGAEVTTNTTNGNDGVGFGGSAIGAVAGSAWVQVASSPTISQGRGGSTSTVGGGSATTVAEFFGAAGGASGTAGGGEMVGSGGGGGGGSITGANLLTTGGVGGGGAKSGEGCLGGATGGTIAGTHGADGTSSPSARGLRFAGGGGGGGAPGDSAGLIAGGNGGNGGYPGGGGGGGGASTNGANSGRGGDGADGYVCIVTLCVN